MIRIAGCKRLSGGAAERRARRGVTLAEVAVSSLLVGLLLVASLQASTGVLRNWSAASDEYRAAYLADLLVAEVVQHLYEEADETPAFGREGGETASVRSGWDDTDDYHGWSASPPQETDGTVMSEFSGWTRAVTVRLAAVSNPAATPGTDEGLKLIQVTVTSPSGETLIRNSLRSRWGQLDQPQSVDATWITSVISRLSLTDGTESVAGSSLSNSVEDVP